MKKPYLTYALSAEGKLVHIDSVANGKDPDQPVGNDDPCKTAAP